MRELDECTAEVFRRGEKRIRERRKNRNRVLALCVPICLIVAAWSAMSLSAMLLAGDTSGHAPLGESAGNAPESLVCPYTAVEIRNESTVPEEYSGKVTDQLAVADLFHTVQSLFADADRNGIGQNTLDNLPAEETDKNGNLTESPDTAKEYTILFTAGDGSRAVYHLSGNTLVNTETEEAVILSDSQAAGLLAVLGLAE